MVTLIVYLRTLVISWHPRETKTSWDVLRCIRSVLVVARSLSQMKYSYLRNFKPVLIIWNLFQMKYRLEFKVRWEFLGWTAIRDLNVTYRTIQLRNLGLTLNSNLSILRYETSFKWDYITMKRVSSVVKTSVVTRLSIWILEFKIRCEFVSWIACCKCKSEYSWVWLAFIGICIRCCTCSHNSARKRLTLYLNRIILEFFYLRQILNSDNTSLRFVNLTLALQVISGKIFITSGNFRDFSDVINHCIRSVPSTISYHKKVINNIRKLTIKLLAL